MLSFTSFLVIVSLNLLFYYYWIYSGYIVPLTINIFDGKKITLVKEEFKSKSPY